MLNPMTDLSDGVYTISVDGREVSINTSDDGKKKLRPKAGVLWFRGANQSRS